MSRSHNEHYDDSYSEYQHSVRERVTETYDDLRRSLDAEPGVSPARRRGRSQSPRQMERSPRMRSRSTPRSTTPWEKLRPTEKSDYSYGAAVSRLTTMLNKHETVRSEEKKTIQFTPRAAGTGSMGHAEFGTYTFPQQMHLSDNVAYGYGYPVRELPTPEDCATILQNQTSLMQQLEIENKYVKDETQTLKLKVLELVEENRLLHEEIKRNAIADILEGGIEVPGISRQEVTTERITLRESGGQREMTKAEATKWQTELERITALHTAKASRIETELKASKEENEKFETHVQELQARIRILETMQGSADPDLIGMAGGLCVKCASNDAVLPPSVAYSQKRSVERLTRERDELTSQLAVMRSQYEQMKQKAEDDYQQIKRAVEMVEQAQLEQTQALIQREQLKEELTNMRGRMEEHVEEITRKLTDEREYVRKENYQEREELNAKIKDLTAAFVETQNQLEKTTRDKVALMAELEVARSQLDNFDVDYGKATDSMKMSMTHATLERNTAVGEMSKLKRAINQKEKDMEQERENLKSERNNFKRRLGKAEQDLVETKEQCITLTTNMQQLEREAHMFKLAKENVEKNRTDDLKAITKRAEKRETELNALIDNLEAKQTLTVQELEGIVSAHESLIHKLKEECKRLTEQLENVSSRYKRDNKQLKSHNEQLRMRLERSFRRLQELENTHTQGGILQEKMRQRIKQLDEHALHTSSQLLELLSREAALMKDRQILAREVEFLRKNLMSSDTAHFEKLLSGAHHTMVDDILVAVRNESESKVKEKVIDDIARMKADFDDIDDMAKDLENEKDSYSESVDTLDDVYQEY